MGTVYFSVGTIAEGKDVEEPVSVKDFDVALHAVFENKAAKARYLESERHKQFVDENSDFLSILKLWTFWVEKHKNLGSSQLRKHPRQFRLVRAIQESRSRSI